jgi:hypothetical protein
MSVDPSTFTGKSHADEHNTRLKHVIQLLPKKRKSNHVTSWTCCREYSLPPQTRPPIISRTITTKVSLVFLVLPSHLLRVNLYQYTNITRVSCRSSKVSGPWSIRESQATKLLEGGGFTNAQGATFNHVSGNQINIDCRRYYHYLIIIVQMSKSSMIVATICGCTYLAFK